MRPLPALTSASAKAHTMYALGAAIMYTSTPALAQTQDRPLGRHAAPTLSKVAFLDSLVEDVGAIAGPVMQWSADRRNTALRSMHT